MVWPYTHADRQLVWCIYRVTSDFVLYGERPPPPPAPCLLFCLPVCLLDPGQIYMVYGVK